METGLAQHGLHGAQSSIHYVRQNIELQSTTKSAERCKNESQEGAERKTISPNDKQKRIREKH